MSTSRKPHKLTSRVSHYGKQDQANEFLADCSRVGKAIDGIDKPFGGHSDELTSDGFLSMVL